MTSGKTPRRLDEALLGALTDGLDLSGTLERVYALTGIASAVLALDGSASARAPDSSEFYAPLYARLDKLREAPTGLKAAQLLRGAAVSMLPGEVLEGAVLLRMVPAGAEPRHLLVLVLPLGMPAESGEAALERLAEIYGYFAGHGGGLNPAGHRMSYLESGLARELILGDGDLAHSVFGSLYDLSPGGSGGSLVPGYCIAAFASRTGEPGREAERGLARLLPGSFRLRDGKRLMLFACGLSREQRGQLRSKLDYFAGMNDLYGGVSEIFDDLSARAGFRRQALLALKLAGRDTDTRLAYASDCYQELLLSGAIEQVGSRVLLLSEVLELVDFDERNHVDYVSTLEKYLAFGNHLSAAAASMFIDRSTMKYRLQKIEDIFGIDVDDPATARRFELGIAVYRLSQSEKNA